MGMLKASRMTGPGSTLGLGLYSNFYSKMAAVACRGLYTGHVLSQSPIFSTASTAAVELYSSLQLYSVSTVYSLYTTPLGLERVGLLHGGG